MTNDEPAPTLAEMNRAGRITDDILTAMVEQYRTIDLANALRAEMRMQWKSREWNRVGGAPDIRNDYRYSSAGDKATTANRNLWHLKATGVLLGMTDEYAEGLKTEARRIARYQPALDRL